MQLAHATDQLLSCIFVKCHRNAWVFNLDRVQCYIKCILVLRALGLDAACKDRIWDVYTVQTCTCKKMVKKWGFSQCTCRGQKLH